MVKFLRGWIPRRRSYPPHRQALLWRESLGELKMVSPLPPLLENATLHFSTTTALIPDPVTGATVPSKSGNTIDFVVFIKPAIGGLGSKKIGQSLKPGADTRTEELECYLIRPMELPANLNYQDGGTIERRDPSGTQKGTILELKMDTRIPLVTSIVGRHLLLSVEWTNHGH